MTRRQTGSFTAKHPGKTGDPRIMAVVQEQAREGEYPCAAAERLAAALDVPLAEVGVVLDLTETRISHCQLGLFGYHPVSRIITAAAEVPPALEEAIRHALVAGRLPCSSAWAIAAAHGLPRMAVAVACEALQIKITACQLGAF
ncbi:MAG: hypothetical protein N2Z74_08095 [Syntrophales bacterium]|nr:hypothetical protein [Syntrophales bacterium]